KYYSGNYQTLSSANQLQVLKDLWANTPKTQTNPPPPADDLTGFSNILPSDFAYELTFMTWAGFLMDPLYGGNQNMVGWDYVGFNGVNFGNFYGEGFDQKTLMVASSPTKLKPASLAQYQQQATGGGMGRFGPWAYEMASRTASAYGLGFLASINPQDDTHDWPLDYAHYEPYYVEWEKAHGICGNYNGSPSNSQSDINYPWMSQN